MLLEGALIVACLPVLACSTYLFGLTLMSSRPRAPEACALLTRFCIVIPAHNEQLNVAATVQSVLDVDYPRDRRRVLVVADNCTDDTADRARTAGATVLVRTDATHRGKGYALAAAFRHLLEQGDADVAVVVDADTRVTANLLRALAVRFERGAPAVQSGNAVANRDASWRTRLMSIAFALFNDVRSVARDRLGLSCGLRGNGMAVSVRMLQEVPYDAFSRVEDLEYGVRLGEAGYRVWYAGEARVESEMVTTEKESRSQRRRWEEGRKELSRSLGVPLLRRALRTRSALLFDLAVDLVIPPLSYVVSGAVLGSILATALYARGWVGPSVPGIWVTCLVMLAAYVSRGVCMSGAGWRGFAHLAVAPAYVGWKLALRLRPRRKDQDWVRTSREGERR